MKEEFERLVAAGKLSRQHVDALVNLTQSGYCMHRSWGFGKITTVDTVFNRFTIDFPSKSGHTMDLSFAAESLKPIPSDHILARKSADLEALRQMAAKPNPSIVSTSATNTAANVASNVSLKMMRCIWATSLAGARTCP